MVIKKRFFILALLVLNGAQAQIVDSHKQAHKDPALSVEEQQNLNNVITAIEEYLNNPKDTLLAQGSKAIDALSDNVKTRKANLRNELDKAEHLDQTVQITAQPTNHIGTLWLIKNNLENPTQKLYQKHITMIGQSLINKNNLPTDFYRQWDTFRNALKAQVLLDKINSITLTIDNIMLEYLSAFFTKQGW